MIKASDALRIARSLIGTPYSELDCINLIKKVIRTAPGGEKDYTTAGTNTLWKSIDGAKEYRDLIWRQEGISGARAGMLAFKRSGTDVHHVGIVTGEGTVIHSSSVYGKAVETALDGSWQLLAIHRLVETEEVIRMEARESGVVRTQGGKLNVRRSPNGAVITQIANGTQIAILEAEGDWLHIGLEDGQEGYVSAAYVGSVQELGVSLRIVDEAGNTFFPQGGFTVRAVFDVTDEGQSE